jgi:lysophospholipase L1-like esterase
LKSDIAHPNAKGYQQMAEGIFDFLKDNGAISD